MGRVGTLTAVTNNGVSPAAALAFQYYPDGRRASKTVSRFTNGVWAVSRTLQYAWEGWKLAAECERDGAGNVAAVRHFVWGPDLAGQQTGALDSDAEGGGGLLLIREWKPVRGVRIYLPLTDGLGSVCALIDASDGSLAAEFDYDPYGTPVIGRGPAMDACPFRHRTRYYDSETWLYYYGYRYYDPSVAKWISKDPLGEAGGWNLTAFCDNDPVNKFDPTGLEGEWLAGGHGVIWQSQFGRIGELFRDIGNDFISTPLSLGGDALGWSAETFGPPLRGLGVTVGLHLQEGIYSPIRSVGRIYDTGLSLDLINPFDRQFVVEEILDGCVDSVRVVGGLPISLLSGDFLDVQGGMSFDPVRPTVSFNGVFNDPQVADVFAREVRRRLAISSSTHIQNRTTYVGDFIQILGNEFGFVDITAIRGARALRVASQNGTSIYVIAHSQGTMTFFASLALVDSPDIRSSIRYQGFGSEMFVSASYMGLGSAENTWNQSASRCDSVPISNYCPTPMKLLGTHIFLPGYGDWNRVDSPMNATQDGLDGNMHSFFYYIPFVHQ